MCYSRLSDVPEFYLLWQLFFFPMAKLPCYYFMKDYTALQNVPFRQQKMKCAHRNHLSPVSSSTVLQLSIILLPSTMSSPIVKCIIRYDCSVHYNCVIHTFCLAVIRLGEEISRVFRTGLQANMLQSFAFLLAFTSFFRFDNVRLNIDALKSLQRNRWGRGRVLLWQHTEEICCLLVWGV